MNVTVAASGSSISRSSVAEGSVETESLEAVDTADNSTADDEYYDESLAITDRRILDEDKQNILFEILKCAVCLEIPRGKQNLQVRICEKGHHFCSPCHKKLRKCAICRGRLFIGRNFVVEELITKLGPNLGISKCRIPPPEAPPKPSPGKYRCLHQCSNYLPSCKMLVHIKNHHNDKLVENVRSNPYTGRFDWMFNIITLTPDKEYTLSTQISDMGLFTVVVTFKDNNLFGYILVLGDENIASLYRYQLTARIRNENNSWNDYTASNCNISHCNVSVDRIIKSGHVLKVDGANLQDLFNKKDDLQILFSIWKANAKKGDKDKEFEVPTVVPEVPIVFSNDRKTRRNRTRNQRKKKLKAKLRSIKGAKNELVKSMSALKIVKSDSSK